MITKKSEAEEYVEELWLRNIKLHKEITAIKKDIVQNEDEIEKFRNEFNITDEDMSDIIGDEFGGGIDDD